MRIIKDNAVAVAIDFQSKLFPFIHEHEQLELTVIKLINGMKVLGIPIIVTEQYPKGIGYTTDMIKKALQDEYKPIEKMTFSCCDSDEFMNKLDSFNKKFVIICGIESHVCVLQTVVDLTEKDFVPVLVEDCVSSRKLSDKRTAIERMRQEGAIISTYESILFELCRISGIKEFRAISKIVK